ncbi:MAG: thioredoxin domain-containing protein [Alphaproteobacteria bacterium]|nr:thioredoxin domain-containing protein [Alphaproteobacteria bacterium]
MKNPAAKNLLSNETSPYLLQHADNPVHWRAWNDDTLAEARRTARPILLSIGYSACHWCHVMAHECFEDQEIADVMNGLFINIKVDREERPDLDSIYQHALALMGVQGGWPLTMFCTTDAKPFWGGTYFPPRPAFGRPGFADILKKTSEIYTAKSQDVARNTQTIMDGLAKLSSPAAGPRLDQNDIKALAAKLEDSFDPVHGGFFGAPKFPMVSTVKLAWRLAHRGTSAQGDDEAPGEATGTDLAAHVLRTADGLAMGGIYDHLGGGLARYTVEERWLVPHFEKMLYDNALFVDLLAHLWRRTENPLYAQRLEETIDWAVREMAAGDGGFAAALDADTEGVEGKFYVWSESEINEVLGDDAALFAQHYDVTAHGNWEGHSILNRLGHRSLADAATEKKLAASRTKLMARRTSRVAPGRDDKVLVDWNGMMIAALVEAATALDRADWLALAKNCYGFIVANVSDRATGEGALHHSWQGDGPRFRGLLEDYANMIRAALALFEATGDQAYLRQARAWTDFLDTHFAAEGGAYHQSDERAGDLILRTLACYDQPVPSGNSLMAENLARLFYFTGAAPYRDRADALISVFAHEARGNVTGFSHLVGAADFLANAAQIIVMAPASDDALGARLRHAAFTAPVPNKIVIPQSSGELASDHPAFGKTPVDGKAAAYVCRGQTCSLPITDPAALRQELDGG